jgi:hypothetical protein
MAALAGHSRPDTAEQLRQLVDLCRLRFGREAPDPGVPLGSLPSETLLILSVCRLSQACTLLGDVAMAQRLYERLLPYQDRSITLVANGSERTCAAAYYVGLLAANLAHWDRAVEHFDRALHTNERLGATYDAAQTRYAYASVLVVRGHPGDWEQARELLSDTVNALAAREADSATPGTAGRSTEGHGHANARSMRQDDVVTPRYLFRVEGDYWTVAYDSRPFHLRDMRGLQYIERLLRRPHHDLHVLDLVALAPEAPTRFTTQDFTAHAFGVSRLDETLPALDARARRAYVSRLRDLRTEQADATSNNDLGRASALQREIDFLATQLLAASRPAGARCAATASPVERARVNVRNAITGALKAIAPHHAELARHLRNAIRTGTTCCYAPDRPLNWSF